jgi:hypothetical protein
MIPELKVKLSIAQHLELLKLIVSVTSSRNIDYIDFYNLKNISRRIQNRLLSNNHPDSYKYLFKVNLNEYRTLIGLYQIIVGYDPDIKFDIYYETIFIMMFESFDKQAEQFKKSALLTKCYNT